MSTISNVTRYRAGLDEDGIVCHREKEDGRWVKYEDYEQLEKELLALRKDREKVVNGGCEKCGGNGSVEIDHGEMGIEHMQCPNCVAKPVAETDNTAQQFESLAGKASVPAGWKLVPIEPTVEMQIAFAETWFSKVRCIDDCELEDAYIAMLAAAPEPCK
ncbi:Hypothetical phage protein [Cronobacter universalis NCTC 9529]|uniref:Uncharacterized protein n=1 Tax=Cronobacter universalis NCTC 9529 TaxID=1074000 RepID=A0AAC8VQC0_9ENTR|nr:hypothetical protein [Cronobacter universalis]ALB54869.1 hypothetical protein AFK65_09405 [Cronobacter universalis NCTC 9529]CCK17688.1 Hypothetical phage protein [Cronobacter universalis NCTC 9529]STD07160.1 Uncharacterised protein [Cronobacter universalis NCTC 9529]